VRRVLRPSSLISIGWPSPEIDGKQNRRTLTVL
jgi:hypothetical protein